MTRFHFYLGFFFSYYVHIIYTSLILLVFPNESQSGSQIRRIRNQCSPDFRDNTKFLRLTIFHIFVKIQNNIKLKYIYTWLTYLYVSFDLSKKKKLINLTQNFPFWKFQLDYKMLILKKSDRSQSRINQDWNI
jgi:hypothetical protein